MERYRRTFDTERRISLYRRLQEILYEEQPYTFLFVGRGDNGLQPAVSRGELVSLGMDGFSGMVGGSGGQAVPEVIT